MCRNMPQGFVASVAHHQGPPDGVLWPSVEAELENMVSNGILSKGEFDARITDQLKVLSETSCLEVCVCV